MRRDTQNRALKPLLVILGFLIAALVLLMACCQISIVLGRAQKPQPSELGTEQGDALTPEEVLAQAQALADAADKLYQPPPPTLEDVEGIVVDLIPQSRYTWGDEPLDEVTCIVIHYTGNPGTTAKQNRDYFASLARTGEDAASSHFVIGIDGEIIQCVPLNYRSYASNHRNRDTIAIECCHPDATGEFTEETLNSLKALVYYLACGYHLDRDDVIRHYDVTGKLCPLYYVEHEDKWESLKDEIFPLQN
jgi:hypothetical protein